MKPCTCEAYWNPSCPKHGLSKEDPRQEYLTEDYQNKLLASRINRTYK